MAEFSVQPLVEAWRRASEEVRREIGHLAEAAAQRAAQRIQTSYPRRSGLLQGAVRVSDPRGWSVSGGALVPAKVVRVTGAPHVHFVEDGTAQRVDLTKRTPARRGAMPRLGPIFVPVVVQERDGYLREAQARLDQPREVI